jgi:hypothetical protein
LRPHSSLGIFFLPMQSDSGAVCHAPGRLSKAVR